MMEKKSYTYEEAVVYALQIPKFTKKNTPGERSGLIHVAGTN